MKKNYICILFSLMGFGLFLFVFVNSSVAATKCGAFPESPDCITCDNIAQEVPKDCAVCDATYEKYRTDSDNHVKCTDKEYNNYMKPTLIAIDKQNAREAAEKERSAEEKACNDALQSLAQKASKCKTNCVSGTGDACRKACHDMDASYEIRSKCVNTTCKKKEGDCKLSCEVDFDKEVPVRYTQCLADASDKYNKKIELIGRGDWTALEKMLNEDSKREEEKKIANEKVKLETARTKNPELTTISTDGKGVAVRKADGSWKTVYAETDLEAGDVIYTKSDSATINYSDGSKINVAPGSSFKYSDTKLLIELRKEINLLRGKIKLWGKRFEVRTPTSIGAVRSTEFIVDYNPNAKITTFYLYEGIIDVSNLKGEIVELNKGETITVDSFGKMILGKLDQEKWSQLSEEIIFTENPTQTAQSSATKQETIVQSSGKSILWLVLIGLIGLLVYVVKRIK